MAARADSSIYFCFCGPVASGKSTLTRKLLERDRSLLLSVSTTTRSPRPGEQHATDYFFVSDDEFQRRLDSDLFVEHTTVTGKRYGTERRNGERAEAEKADLLLDIEFNGAENFKRAYPGRVVVIFVIPPSIAALKERLNARGGLTEEQAAARLQLALDEIQVLGSADFSDYLIVNDDVQESTRIALAIIDAERRRLRRYSPSFLDSFIEL